MDLLACFHSPRPRCCGDSADIHKSEVFKVGAQLGVPASTLQAAPSADLWDGQEDEEVLFNDRSDGVPFLTACPYIR